MHEMSLCESMLQILEQQAVEQGYTKITTVRLEIGKLSSVEPEAMRFAFEVVRRGTLAEQAKLEILEIEGKAWCVTCQQQIIITQRYDGCPLCGAYQLLISDGEQMRIKELEVI
jgi:hydrogenase nickel incorporation protein HypA/HybF